MRPTFVAALLLFSKSAALAFAPRLSFTVSPPLLHQLSSSSSSSASSSRLASSTTTTTLNTNGGDASVEEYERISRSARPGRPLKVAIAGGGVGGLTAALCLLKNGCDVTVYEKTAAFARFGGPIQFASNALSVLKEIDDTLFQRVMDKFTFTGTRTCGIKDGLRANGSFRMTTDSIDYLWNPDAPADWFVKFPLKVRRLVQRMLHYFLCLLMVWLAWFTWFGLVFQLFRQCRQCVCVCVCVVCAVAIVVSDHWTDL